MPAKFVGLAVGVIFLRAATKAAATCRVAAVFTGPLLAGPLLTDEVLAAAVPKPGALLVAALLGAAVFAAAVLAAVSLEDIGPALLVSIVCAMSAAFFFFVGISAFRSLGTAVLATAAGLGVETGSAAFVARVPAAAIGRRAAFGVGRGVLAAFVVFGLAGVGLADVAFAGFAVGPLAAPLALPALPAGSFDAFGTALVAPPVLPPVVFDLAAAAPTLKEECDSGFATDLALADAGFFGAGVLAAGVLAAGVFGAAVLGAAALGADVLALAAFVDAVGFTAERALAPVFDEALLVVLPRGVAAALTFGGMGNHS